MSHLLDANVFMEAGRTYYRPRVAPGFWEWLATSAGTGVIASTEGVRDEIGRGSSLGAVTGGLPAHTWRVPTERVTPVPVSGGAGDSRGAAPALS